MKIVEKLSKLILEVTWSKQIPKGVKSIMLAYMIMLYRIMTGGILFL